MGYPFKQQLSKRLTYWMIICPQQVMVNLPAEDQPLVHLRRLMLPPPVSSVLIRRLVTAFVVVKVLSLQAGVLMTTSAVSIRLNISASIRGHVATAERVASPKMIKVRERKQKATASTIHMIRAVLFLLGSGRPLRRYQCHLRISISTVPAWRALTRCIPRTCRDWRGRRHPLAHRSIAGEVHNPQLKEPKLDIGLDLEPWGQEASQGAVERVDNQVLSPIKP